MREQTRHGVPFKKQRKPKAFPWQNEVDLAVAICTPFGCVVERSPHDYEIATVRGDGVQLVIYPHRTTAGHHHARVRDNGSKDKIAARTVMLAMNNGTGLPEPDRSRVAFSCTFQAKKYP